MGLLRISAVLALACAIGGCATSSSKAFSDAPVAAATGPVFVTQVTLPATIDYKVVGSVSAEANSGYERVPALYPLLAEEARKIGANAVMSAQGGRRLAPFSWSAAYVSGTAVYVKDLDKLRGLTGSYH